MAKQKHITLVESSSMPLDRLDFRLERIDALLMMTYAGARDAFTNMLDEVQDAYLAAVHDLVLEARNDLAELAEQHEKATAAQKAAVQH